jgi:hypothetical protein
MITAAAALAFESQPFKNQFPRVPLLRRRRLP